MKLRYSILFLLLSAFTLKAQIIRIPADQPTIQAGIENAQDGDTILVEEGTYFENIDFLGKPVTVASRFILDGDTSHISKTTIDGSQSTKVDTGSVVLMKTMEDTTSVLMGFTITGGTGSVINVYWNPTEPERDLIGGGIAVVNAGGKIIHNIIEYNSVNAGSRSYLILGGGIFAAVSNNRTVIIRNNIIRNNFLTSNHNEVIGAGMAFLGGRLLVENNQITGNIANRPGGSSIGGGFYWAAFDLPAVIGEVFFRNNIITHNQCLGEGTYVWGGGAILGFDYGNPVEFYNNVVAYNYSGKQGGGLYIYESDMNLFNNTIYMNRAELSGNNLEIENSACRIFNNIIWSDTTAGGNRNIEILGYNMQALYYNLLSESFGPYNTFTGEGNVFIEPTFKDGSFEPDQNSPAIGRGTDSLMIGSVWHKAPASDILGNSRPGDVDQYIDIGAYESEFSRLLTDNTDLASIGAVGHSLDPEFHKDTLNYLMIKEPWAKLTDIWYIYPADNLASLEVDKAQDLTSENEQDRTTKILVTSSDGTSQKQYTVIYNYYSSDTTLASLEVSKGVLEPEFNPQVIEYFDTIPYGIKTVPEVFAFANDTSASIFVKNAQDVYSLNPVLRTTTIKVTSPNGLFSQDYTVLFTMDRTKPEVTLIQDSVEIGGEIGVLVAESNHVYLVPVNTPGIFDSIVDAQLVDMETGMADTVFLSTSGVELEPGTFWLYACDRHQSVSDSREVVIFEVDHTSIYGQLEETIQVYPSPVSQTLYFDSPYPLEQVELYNVIGMVVLKVKKPAGNINVSHLPDGVYILRMMTRENQIYVTRFIKR